MASTGVSSDDFAQILEDFKRTLTYYVSTKTTDSLTGDETETFATAVELEAIFFLNENRWLFDKEGLTEVGDAYIMVVPSVGIKRYDKFTVDNKTYYIQNIIQRYVVGVQMVDYGVCFEVS
jgi:hypothetical protein